MTGVGSEPRDFQEFVIDTRKRSVALERQTRFGGIDLASLDAGDGLQMTGEGTPDSPVTISVSARLGSTGQEVLDWNDAMVPGFYWSYGALNSPTGTTAWGETIGPNFQGTVSINTAAVATNGRTIQTINQTDQSLFPITYRRYWNGTAWGAWIVDDSRDSGWVDLASVIISPFVVNGFLGRRIGPVAELIGSINGSVALGTSVVEFGTNLPTVFRPAGALNVMGAAYLSGMSTTVIVRPAGTMALSNRNSIAATNFQFTVTYFLG